MAAILVKAVIHSQQLIKLFIKWLPGLLDGCQTSLLHYVSVTDKNWCKQAPPPPPPPPPPDTLFHWTSVSGPFVCLLTSQTSSSDQTCLFSCTDFDAILDHLAVTMKGRTFDLHWKPQKMTCALF